MRENLMNCSLNRFLGSKQEIYSEGKTREKSCPQTMRIHILQKIVMMQRPLDLKREENSGHVRLSQNNFSLATQQHLTFKQESLIHRSSYCDKDDG